MTDDPIHGSAFVSSRARARRNAEAYGTPVASERERRHSWGRFFAEGATTSRGRPGGATARDFEWAARGLAGRRPDVRQCLGDVLRANPAAALHAPAKASSAHALNGWPGPVEMRGRRWIDAALGGKMAAVCARTYDGGTQYVR
jgi:hypothetical protein